MMKPTDYTKDYAVEIAARFSGMKIGYIHMNTNMRIMKTKEKHIKSDVRTSVRKNVKTKTKGSFDDALRKLGVHIPS